MDNENCGIKKDNGKPHLELLPPMYWQDKKSVLSYHLANWFYYRESSERLKISYDPTPVLEFGCNKYSAHNWHKGMKWSRIVGSFHRHCNKLVNGVWVPRNLEELDEESMLPHGCHAACNLFFLLEYYSQFCLGNLIGENDCVWNLTSPVVKTTEEVREGEIMVFDIDFNTNRDFLSSEKEEIEEKKIEELTKKINFLENEVDMWKSLYEDLLITRKSNQL